MKKRFLIWDNPKDAIISLTLLLMLVGCINVFSASFVEARDMFEDGYYYLKRYLIFGWDFVRLRIKRGSTIFG